ncbi:MAG: CD225/dispanin family protein [Acidobacteriota bacterium]
MSLLGIDNTPEDAVRQAAVQSKANTIFILSLVSILFCCIGGIAASIVANRAKNDAAAGNLSSAESQISTAMVLMILSFVLGGLGTVARLMGAFQ